MLQTEVERAPGIVHKTFCYLKWRNI